MRIEGQKKYLLKDKEIDTHEPNEVDNWDLLLADQTADTLNDNKNV